MSTQTEKEAVKRLIDTYAQALNAADSVSIPQFYTIDGQFIPEGTKLTPARELKAKGEGYFKEADFHIDYSIQSIVMDGGYAFVNATAKTASTNHKTKREASHISQDFFVLRKEQEEWKIFRYLFNNVVEQ